MENKEKLFRQSALERLSSPERLDQLMQVINPMDWIALSTLGILVGGTLIWSIVGRIPLTVEGRGVFIRPHQVIDLQANVAGQLSALKVEQGKCVEKGALLATIEPTDLKQQLQLTQGKLTQLQAQRTQELARSDQRMNLEQSTLAATRVSLVQRLNNTSAIAPVLQTKGLESIQEQRRSLEQRLQDARAMIPVMEERVDTRRQLYTQGGIAQDTLLQAEREYTQSRQTAAEVEAQIKQLEVQIAETDRNYLTNLQTVGELEAQLQELDTKAVRIDQENRGNQKQQDREIQEVTREIARLEQQITTNSKIISPQAGCILELNLAVGQVVQPGARLGSIQISQANRPIAGILYFPIKDGKQIQPGMSLTITPDTVQRERFGGIVAEVKTVSELPITRENATSVIGNSEVVQTLVGESGAVMQVNAELAIDLKTRSGHKWSSSQGTSSPITSGTTATARVTVEQRAPITFVLPFLRDLFGLKE
jgi:HlyD family secretion protein